MNERKIAAALEECLCNADRAVDALVYETEFLSKLQVHPAWRAEEVAALRAWLKRTRNSEEENHCEGR